MISEKEEEFFDKIDEKLPFKDPMACREIISEAVSISPLACMQIIKEICCIEDYMREDISDMELTSMINEIKRRFEHPLKERVVETALIVLKGEELSEEAALAGLAEVRKYPEYYAPLWIYYFSCYADSVDKLKEEIVDEWDAMA